jgi:glycosyltransferase involved in cell wall biosynthesis
MTRAAVFAYPQALTYSGQTAATLLAVRELETMGWDCRPVEFTALDRAQVPLRRHLRYGLGVLGAWALLAADALRGRPAIVFSHGQSLISFLRMGLPHLVLRRLLPRRQIVTSLHGSVFMTWARDSREMRIFLRLLHSSNDITVLGTSQRDYLVELGVPASRVTVLPNTADLALSKEEGVRTKHMALAADPAAPLVLLHLSLLIESKGYVVFLEACHALARAEDRPSRPLEILLVGPMAFTGYCTRFTTPEAKRAWIEAKIAALNALPGVSARWIEGAQGAEKEALFDAAHVFVFPSRFPVEAQPLVLLEAMAAGCALVASDQGEIPSTMGSDTGLCLADVSVLPLTAAIGAYAADHDRRLTAALAGRQRAARDFSARAYGENWNRLLTGHRQEGEA